MVIVVTKLLALLVAAPIVLGCARGGRSAPHAPDANRSASNPPPPAQQHEPGAGPDGLGSVDAGDEDRPPAIPDEKSDKPGRSLEIFGAVVCGDECSPAEWAWSVSDWPSVPGVVAVLGTHVEGEAIQVRLAAVRAVNGSLERLAEEQYVLGGEECLARMGGIECVCEPPRVGPWPSIGEKVRPLAIRTRCRDTFAVGDADEERLAWWVLTPRSISPVLDVQIEHMNHDRVARADESCHAEVRVGSAKHGGVPDLSIQRTCSVRPFFKEEGSRPTRRVQHETWVWRGERFDKR